MSRVRVILWRHGNTDHNASRRIQGQFDAPLNEVGLAQAAAAAPALAALKPDLLLSSDLSRASRTAGALAGLAGLAVERDPRLRERHFGDFQDLLVTEAQARFADTFARWQAGDPDPGNGIEPIADLGKRVAEAIREAADRLPDGGLAVLATHGGAAKYGVASLLGWPDEIVTSVHGLDNCHWTELRRYPGRTPDDQTVWRLHAHNAGV